ATTPPSTAAKTPSSWPSNSSESFLPRMNTDWHGKSFLYWLCFIRVFPCPSVAVDCSSELCALGLDGLFLGGPVGEAAAFLLDDRGGGVPDEGRVAELGLALGDLAGDALEFLVQARALRVEVHQAFQRHQQLEVADHGGGRGGRLRTVAEELDALDLVEEA